MNNKFLAGLQKLGKALMTPVAVLPAAALLLRLGAEDVLNIKWMNAAGDAVFGNLALIFAIGIAIGLAEENNGVAGLAAAVGYFVLTKVAATFNEKINMGVLAGIIVGVLAGYLYNKYKAIKVPDFLGFFGGKRFVPIVTSFYTLIIGVLAGYVWPLIQNAISSFGNAIANSGAIGAGIFGFLNRLLIPFGLHHVLNSFVWFQFGEFTNASGKVVTGDLTRFFAKDPTAGTFMTGFFPIMMFALPAACFAMISAAKKENRKAVTGMLLGVALTSFLTGITEPIEFLFMFIAPALYFIHAVLTGLSLALTTALGIRLGFGFSAGLIDYILSFGIASKPLLAIVIGLIFAIFYYIIFLYVIKKYNLPTPGRINEESAVLSNLGNNKLKEKGSEILKALGGKENISVIDACVTRIRVTVKDSSLVNEARLKELGATGVLRMGSNNFQVVVGTIADPLVTHIKTIM
ncbi:N-acetylglucosamine-specific PTS transporter subunit IIBC [Fonticella tunisiensis]|uniref:PTS system N-acetylglucosamine-specific IIB component (Glc family) /PTS system N-acetylglucosamine-specific IIC component (Glc family) n=1 Tax=Fonticella tunisiensis TaxID=1096341 RepID=A0A4R7KSY3_9CLOT|nr:N-acetylglucosamine-specific PTS transporter subunit IIBC [Fonticella tunisiensis]TDT62822.1 PTS system N-acetylglucosamine-specific IIB component (Glc family) /PTS system N-acetylglucosamine-specific IIC component (Glc family) [Fonticella tunisiensis]